MPGTPDRIAHHLLRVCRHHSPPPASVFTFPLHGVLDTLFSRHSRHFDVRGLQRTHRTPQESYPGPRAPHTHTGRWPGARHTHAQFPPPPPTGPPGFSRPVRQRGPQACSRTHAGGLMRTRGKRAAPHPRQARRIYGGAMPTCLPALRLLLDIRICQPEPARRTVRVAVAIAHTNLAVRAEDCIPD